MASAEKDTTNILQQLHSLNPSNIQQSAPQLLSRAKISLLHLNALVPSPSTSTQHLHLAREVLETGALISIQLKDPEAFTRYFAQLQPFYDLPSSRYGENNTSSHGSDISSQRVTRSTTSHSSQSPFQTSGNRSKITGLYLLLLLSQGDYAGFHTEIEKLENSGFATQGHGGILGDDPFIAYPIRLEQALMEGSYDRVWGETKGERIPSEEFGIFTEVLINTIRAEIASCSERAYPSLPITNAKNLLFLDSEGAVVSFAKSRGWIVEEGRIYFPASNEDINGGSADKDVLAVSGQLIENTLGYARKLETIV